MPSVFPGVSPIVDGRIVFPTFDPLTRWRRNQNARVEYGLRQWLIGGEPLASRQIDTLRFTALPESFNIHSLRSAEREAPTINRAPVLSLGAKVGSIVLKPSCACRYWHNEWVLSCLLGLKTLKHDVHGWTVHIEDVPEAFPSLKRAMTWLLYDWRPVWAQDYHREYFEARL